MVEAINSTVPTLADLLRERDTDNIPDSERIDLSTISMPLFEDIPMFMCNDKNSDTYVTPRTLEAQDADFVDYNDGYLIGTTRGDSTRSTPSKIGNANQISKDLCDSMANGKEYRHRQNMGAKQGLTQKVATSFFYSNKSEDSRAFKGLAEIFNHHQTANRNEIGYNVIDAGGATGNAQTSIYVLALGVAGIHGIHSKDSKSIIVEDIAKEAVPIKNVALNKVEKFYFDTFSMNVGLHVADWRASCRICNIDANWFSTANLGDADGGNMCDIDDLLLQALGKIPQILINQSLKLRVFMNKDVANAWTRYTRALSKNTTLSVLDHAGANAADTIYSCKSIPGIQVRIDDCLRLNEDVVLEG